MAPQGSLGILVGGGPAPGLNGVISAVTIEARRRGVNVLGIYDGFKCLVQGAEKAFIEHIRELEIPEVSRIHFQGGSILRTSRINPSQYENGAKKAAQILEQFGIKYLATIGGNDTAYSAWQIAREAKDLKIAHIPKTIDNDLPLPNNMPTFGYETARDLGAQLVRNLMEDARTTQRWYMVVSMGRHTGHLALGIGKAAGATLTIIPEEFEDKGTIDIERIVDIVETAIIKRRAMDRHHGVVVIAEGVAERLDKEQLEQMQGAIKHDGFGNIILTRLELGKLVSHVTESRFANRREKLDMVDLNLGHLLRCAPPIPFDQEYTRDLGYHATDYLLSEDPADQANAMIVVDNGKLEPVPLDALINPETKKISLRKVNIQSDAYKVARFYMVRLDAADMANSALIKSMAGHMQLTETQFKEKFGHLTG